MKNIITNELFNSMLNDYNNGCGLIEISNKFGFQEQTIQKHFRKIGIRLIRGKSKKFSEDELKSIIADYNSGMKPFELADRYNRNSGTIICKLQSIGVYDCSNYRFTDDDIEFLKQYYPLGDWTSIRKRFPLNSDDSIHTKMSKIGISMNSYYWNDYEEKLLISKYNSMYGCVSDLVKLFNYKFSYDAITSKANNLGLKTKELWSEEEINSLILNYPNKTLDEMEKLLLKRNRKTIIAKASELQIRNVVKYSKDQEDFIISNWTSMSDDDMAFSLNKTKVGIIGKRLLLGLLRIKENSSYNDLSEYVRRNNIDWKNESMKNCNYKCYLTGERFQVIHHVYSLNLILNETLEELNISVKETMDDYTQEELRDVLNIFRINQNKYPLGVCLKEDIHKLFHSMYGYGNNTESQWNDFILSYKNNKINVA